jgi:hypothetical protein
MNRDDVIRMAREAGWIVRCLDGIDEVMDGDCYHIQTDLVERFAALVAAAERAACIDDCNAEARDDGTAQRIVERIRARGKA